MRWERGGRGVRGPGDGGVGGGGAVSAASIVAGEVSACTGLRHVSLLPRCLARRRSTAPFARRRSCTAPAMRSSCCRSGTVPLARRCTCSSGIILLTRSCGSSCRAIGLTGSDLTSSCRLRRRRRGTRRSGSASPALAHHLVDGGLRGGRLRPTLDLVTGTVVLGNRLLRHT